MLNPPRQPLASDMLLPLAAACRYFRGRGVDDDKGGIVPVIQVHPVTHSMRPSSELTVPNLGASASSLRRAQMPKAICALVQVLEAYLQTAGRLPVNVKIMFEGQEEIGSPNLLPFLQQHGARFAADFALSADGGQESETQGILALALRGSTAFEVEAKTLDVDVHSGELVLTRHP